MSRWTAGNAFPAASVLDVSEIWCHKNNKNLQQLNQVCERRRCRFRGHVVANETKSLLRTCWILPFVVQLVHEMSDRYRCGNIQKVLLYVLIQ
jgi:hypothetical protein